MGEASSGGEAIQLAAQLCPDLVLLDVTLPDLSGAEVARRIATATPATKVVAISLHEDAGHVQALTDAGAVGFVSKRSAPEQLLLAIEAAGAGRTHLDPLVSPKPSNRQGSGIFQTAKLSEREAEVLRLVASGHTAKEIASTLQLSQRTLETYKARGMSKLSLRTRADLLRFAVRGGWLQDT